MRKVVYTPRANVDLQEIWHFTANRWNVDQADRYIEQLLGTCDALAQGILTGRDCDNIQKGYRRQFVGSHVIFYQESPDAILVIRILHQRMDASSHFEN